MKNLLFALFVVAFGSASALAQATDFATADANADGSVTMEEATAVGITEEKFQTADANSDGNLDQAEFATATAS